MTWAMSPAVDRSLRCIVAVNALALRRLRLPAAGTGGEREAQPLPIRKVSGNRLKLDLLSS